MNNSKMIAVLLIVLALFSILGSVQVTYAAANNDIVNKLTSSTLPSDQNSGGFLQKLLDLLLNKILGPILNIFNQGQSQTTKPPVIVKPLPPTDNGSIVDSGVLRGKVIVLDPGHGGSNPGAVANNVRESDVNLAVGLKLRDKLVQAGAKVIMTRSTDRTVAPEGSSLGQELQARIDIAQANQADIFISLHSNYNDSSALQGAMTFYPSSKTSSLAVEIQSALIKETQAVDKGISPATFYVLRNNNVPSILVEMGFLSNPSEAAKLSNDSYQNKIAQGIFNGTVKYFTLN